MEDAVRVTVDETVAPPAGETHPTDGGVVSGADVLNSTASALHPAFGPDAESVTVAGIEEVLSTMAMKVDP